MASRIFGVDLGAYSVKVVIGTPGLRRVNIEDSIERILPHDADASSERAYSALRDIFAEHSFGEEDAAYLVVSGDQLFMRVVDVEFKNLRRAQLSQAIGTELESTLPVDLEDIVYAFEYIPKSTTEPVTLDETFEDGLDDPEFTGSKRAKTARGVVADEPTGTRVLAAAMLKDAATAELDRVQDCGGEARGMLAFPAAHLRVSEQIPEGHEAKGAGHALALVDIGHQRVDVTVIQGGMAVYARTLGRGGRDLTMAIARAWSLDQASAETTKHQNAFIASPARKAMSESAGHMHAVLHPEITGWVRDIRRTLAACRAKCGAKVGHVVLHGGSSRVAGLEDFLQDQLGLPVSKPSDTLDIFALATGVVFEGGSARPSYDLRQGALAYKGNLSFLRQKASALTVAVLSVLLFAIASGFMGLRKLRKSEAALSGWLAEESTRAFGSELSAEEVMSKVGPVASKDNSPIPDMSAYDLLLDFNDSLPSKEKVTLDVEQVTIKPGKLSLEAVSSPTGEESALQGIKLLEETLRKTTCFKEFSSPESQPSSDGKRTFSLTIETTCNT